MAKPLEDRIAAAMAPGARAATVADLLAEVTSIIGETQTEHDRCDALSKSATAGEAEAEQAGEEAIRLARKITRLDAKLAQLRDRHEGLMASERRKRIVAEHAHARERRDQLADDLREHWPRITSEIVELLRRLVDSDAECERLNKSLPTGCEWLLSAEAQARDCPGNFYLPGGSPIHRFVSIRLPALTTRGFEAVAWPIQPNHAASAEAASRAATLRARAAAATEAEKWQRYLVTPPRGGNPISIRTRYGRKSAYREPKHHVMSPEFVEEARANGLTVVLAPEQVEA